MRGVDKEDRGPVSNAPETDGEAGQPSALQSSSSRHTRL
jgi:hypothetical protein